MTCQDTQPLLGTESLAGHLEEDTPQNMEILVPQGNRQTPGNQRLWGRGVLQAVGRRKEQVPERQHSHKRPSVREAGKCDRGGGQIAEDMSK